MARDDNDDSLSYRGKLLRDLKRCLEPERKQDKQDKQNKRSVEVPDFSESVIENVSSDPYLDELRSKYRSD